LAAVAQVVQAEEQSESIHNFKDSHWSKAADTAEQLVLHHTKAVMVDLAVRLDLQELVD
jgi:hypothetical protein